MKKFIFDWGIIIAVGISSIYAVYYKESAIRDLQKQNEILIEILFETQIERQKGINPQENKKEVIYI